MIEPRKALVAVVAAGAAVAGCAAEAPEEVPVTELRPTRPQLEQGAVPPEVELATAGQTEVAGGWHARELLGAEVRGPGGAKIGEVANIVIGPDAMIQAIVFEAEGALGVGAATLRVPWEQVRPGPGYDVVGVPVTRANVQDYGLFQDFQAREPRAFRATELIGDYVSLEDHPGYAVVDDLVFSPEGELRSVLVSADVEFAGAYDHPIGSYAFPFYGYDYGFDPGLDFFELPYRVGDIGATRRFNLPMMGD